MGKLNRARKEKIPEETMVNVTYTGVGIGTIIKTRIEGLKFPPSAQVQKYHSRRLQPQKNRVDAKTGKVVKAQPVFGSLEHPSNLSITSVRSSLYESNKDKLYKFPKVVKPEDICKFFSETYGWEYEYDEDARHYIPKKEDPVLLDYQERHKALFGALPNKSIKLNTLKKKVEDEEAKRSEENTLKELRTNYETVLGTKAPEELSAEELQSAIDEAAKGGEDPPKNSEEDDPDSDPLNE